MVDARLSGRQTQWPPSRHGHRLPKQRHTPIRTHCVRPCMIQRRTHEYPDQAALRGHVRRGGGLLCTSHTPHRGGSLHGERRGWLHGERGWLHGERKGGEEGGRGRGERLDGERGERASRGEEGGGLDGEREGGGGFTGRGREGGRLDGEGGGLSSTTHRPHRGGGWLHGERKGLDGVLHGERTRSRLP